MRHSLAIALTVSFVLGTVSSAGIDRHPELKSRAVAWSEFDGSFLVEPANRAEMIDFYWTVLARPYPKIGWTGTLNPPAAGSVDERFRVREYAQWNAYRAMQALPIVTENAARLAAQQQGALVMAVRERLSHDIDSSWVGYTPEAAAALSSSNLAAVGADGGIVDQFMLDWGDENAAIVGHRSSLLWHANTDTALGAAQSGTTSYAALFSDVVGVPNVPAEQFTAWPAPGYMPLALFRTSHVFRWSFEPAATFGDRDTSAAVVAAKLNGQPLAVSNVRAVAGWPITWEFAKSSLDLNTLARDADVEITVSNVVIRGQAMTYRYVVKLFDEKTVTRVGFAPSLSRKSISARGTIGSGARALVFGFAVTGSLPMRVALRTQASTQMPRIQLYDASGVLIGENERWQQHQNWRLLQSLGIAPQSSSDAAMVATLWPGTYRTVVTAQNGIEAAGVVEAFSLDNRDGGTPGDAAYTDVGLLELHTAQTDYSVTLTAASQQSGMQWQRDGTDLQASGELTLAQFQPIHAGIYSVSVGGSGTPIERRIVAPLSTVKVIGSGKEVGWDIKHPNGNVFDQVLLTGAAEAVTADAAQITRTSFIDLENNIVQVEFSGPGALSVVLEQPSGPARPVNYNQDVTYMKGHARIVITGATEQTNLSVFAVGKLTAVDPTGAFNIALPVSPTNDPANNGSSLFHGHALADYSGVAGIASVAITSANGKFGAIRTANATFFAHKGITGIYAPGVEFVGPVRIGEISAFDSAQPRIILGAVADCSIHGGDLWQANGQSVEVSGVQKLRFVAGTDSHNRSLPAQANRAKLVQDGRDVTATVVANP